MEKGLAHNHYILEPIKRFHGNLKLTKYHLPLVWYEICTLPEVLLPPNDPPLDDEERENDEDEEEDE